MMAKLKAGLGAGAALALLAASPSALAARAAETIVLTAGFTQMLRPERAVRTIAIGNPQVADATVGDGRTIILTGKAVGTTNLILLDEAGEEISNATVRVTAGRGREIRVRDSDHSRIYLCAPGCELVGASAPAGRVAASAPAPAPASTPAPAPAARPAGTPAPRE